MAKKAGLDEKIAKEALGNLDWPKLKSHLDDIVLDEDKFGVLLGHIRRTNSLIMAYPDPKREKKREEFLGHLQDYAHEKLGKSSLQITDEANLLNKIERGYRSILDFLQQCDVSKLAPDVRAAAYIGRAAGQYDLVTKSLYDALNARKEIGLPAGVLLRDENNAPFSADAAITTIVECLTMTLVMEAYKNKWFDADRNVVLPPLPAVGASFSASVGNHTSARKVWCPIMGR